VAFVAGGPLLTLTLQIEERIVDPNRHSHQENDRLGRIGSVEGMAGERGQADRAEHRREGEQHRHAGRDEGAERQATASSSGCTRLRAD